MNGENGPQNNFFIISSALKDLIGQELVTNRYVAILELVKNSYDAGSYDARIVFHHSNTDNGKVSRILILDSGKGMSKEEIRNKWLFVAYSDKKVVDEESERITAGRKGIGRFSCDRLGAVLDMYTRTKKDNNWNHLHVDWTQFENDQNVEFGKVPVEIQSDQLPNYLKSLYPDDTQGTALVITSIREFWSYDDLFNLRKYLQRMINPFQSPTDFSLYLAAPAFKEIDMKEIAINEDHLKEEYDEEENITWVQKGPVSGKIENLVISKVRERASWITSRVENDRITTELYERGKLLISTVEKNTFNWFGRIDYAEKVETEVFFLDRNSKNIFTRTMGLRPVNFGSIFVYKNAFRVFPYGEEGNDWLELDRAKGQGWRRTLSTRDILGRVSITDRKDIFKEVAARQGFYEDTGTPFQELKEFMLDFVINRLTRYVVEAIKWASEKSPASEEERRIESTKLVGYIVGDPKNFEKIALGSDFLEIVQEKEIQKVPELVKNLEALTVLVPSKETANYVQTQILGLKKGIRELNKNLKEREKEVMFLEKAVPSKEKVANLLDHSVVIAADDVLPSIDKVIERLSVTPGMQELVLSLRSVRISVQKMVKLAELSLSAKFSLGTETVTGNIVSYIKQYVSTVKKDNLDSKGIRITFEGEDLKKEEDFRYLDLAIILDNLVSNSMKAGCKRILIKFTREGDRLAMFFSDDGEGVKAGSVDQLFRPGFSTRNTSGVGLYTIQNILNSLGGSVTFLGNSVGGMEKGACFEVIL